MLTPTELREQAHRRQEEMYLLLVGDEDTTRQIDAECRALEAQAVELERNPPLPQPTAAAVTLLPSMFAQWKLPSWVWGNIWFVVGSLGILAFVLGTWAVVSP